MCAFFCFCSLGVFQIYNVWQGWTDPTGHSNIHALPEVSFCGTHVTFWEFWWHVDDQISLQEGISSSIVLFDPFCEGASQTVIWVNLSVCLKQHRFKILVYSGMFYVISTFVSWNFSNHSDSGQVHVRTDSEKLPTASTCGLVCDQSKQIAWCLDSFLDNQI